jgi:hypothetical protein
MRDHLALARIGNSLPLEIPIDMAALHEIVPCSAHRAGYNFLALEKVLGLGQSHSTKVWGGSLLRHERRRCTIKRGDDDVNVMFGEEWIVDIQN